GRIVRLEGVVCEASIGSMTEEFSGTYVGATAAASPTTTISLTGAAHIAATSSGSTSATANGGGLGLAEVARMETVAITGGVTRAFVGEGTLLTASALTIAATGTTLNAHAEIFVVAIGAVAGAGIFS